MVLQEAVQGALWVTTGIPTSVRQGLMPFSPGAVNLYRADPEAGCRWGRDRL